ncbi:hypothetical protein [Cellvibrio zantedeschiae]|uniref:hypothetical protein n=1 Tax=Cellvibrio zantedeschiae TaxID=1237077 RepID=UPI001676D33B|nr:hypothetical protein [Cellvibrio zantedeschiae]
MPEGIRGFSFSASLALKRDRSLAGSKNGRIAVFHSEAARRVSAMDGANASRLAFINLNEKIAYKISKHEV